MVASQNFNGSNDYLYSSISVPAWPMSACCWFNHDNTAPNAGIINFEESSNRGFGSKIQGTNKIVMWTGSSSQSFENSPTDYTITNGVWNHLAIVGASDTDKRLYINGVEVISWTASRTVAAIDTINMGEIWNSAVNAFPGKICYAHYYNKELTISEINELKVHPGSITENLIAYYPLTQTASVASDFKDLSGNGLNISGGIIPDISSDGPPIYFPGIGQ